MKIFKATVKLKRYKGPKNVILCAEDWNAAWDFLSSKEKGFKDSWNLQLVEELSTTKTEAAIIVEF